MGGSFVADAEVWSKRLDVKGKSRCIKRKDLCSSISVFSLLMFFKEKFISVLKIIYLPSLKVFLLVLRFYFMKMTQTYLTVWQTIIVTATIAATKL